MCIYLNLMIFIKIIRGFISVQWPSPFVSFLCNHDDSFNCIQPAPMRRISSITDCKLCWLITLALIFNKKQLG
ncbi:hypothetical protein D8T54_20875 [Vibrio vulnificus]|nr:hypothetical protein D8T54_20875 [Vibrio vulnificus]